MVSIADRIAMNMRIDYVDDPGDNGILPHDRSFICSMSSVDPDHSDDTLLPPPAFAGQFAIIFFPAISYNPGHRRRITCQAAFDTFGHTYADTGYINEHFIFLSMADRWLLVVNGNTTPTTNLGPPA